MIFLAGRTEPDPRPTGADKSLGVARGPIPLFYEGSDLQDIVKAVKPDVRADKVAKLRMRIAAGAYRVSDDDLIDSILATEAGARRE